MIEIGTVLQDRFLIEEQIGVGGMGAVYRATDQKFGSAVAIKETLYRDKDLAEAFEREARLLNGLHHPLFPHVSDHFTEEDGHFLVMEYIEGEDLSELLKRGERFPFETVMRWTLDLLDGLDYLHSQDPPVIHRDIKPNNLKLTSRGNIVLLDFGMAKETSGNTQGMRSVFGYSRRYSPLEQIEGTGTDVRSDIFSLGATVYHLLTGTPPVDVLRRASTIVSGQPDPIEPASALNPEVPERIAALLNSALALNPDRRFASARAMWSALEHSLDGLQAAPATALAPSASATSLDSEAPANEVKGDNFSALTAFEAEIDEESAPKPLGTDIHSFWEDDDEEQNATAGAVWESEVKAEERGFRSDDSLRPGRIEVPVDAGVGLMNDGAPETNKIPASVPTGKPVAASVWGRSPIFWAIPLLLLGLVLLGYALFRGDSTGDAPMEDAPAQQVVSAEIAPRETVESEPAVEAGPAEDTVAGTDEPESSRTNASNTDDNTKEQESLRGQRAETREQEDVSDAAPVPSVDRLNPPSRDQARNRAAANSRTDRVTRPRVVEERVFEQPPVSSIESVMTGIPAGRPRGQNNWDVLDEDEMRRLRRQRRIERRSRQRWPLF